MMKRMLTRSGRKIRFCSQPATASILREHLNSGCEILHFTGHGDEHSLKVESEKNCGTAESLQVTYFSSLFSANITRLCHLYGKLVVEIRGYISSLRSAVYVQ